MVTTCSISVLSVYSILIFFHLLAPAWLFWKFTSVRYRPFRTPAHRWASLLLPSWSWPASSLWHRNFFDWGRQLITFPLRSYCFMRVALLFVIINNGGFLSIVVVFRHVFVDVVALLLQIKRFFLTLSVFTFCIRWAVGRYFLGTTPFWTSLWWPGSWPDVTLLLPCWTLASTSARLRFMVCD